MSRGHTLCFLLLIVLLVCSVITQTPTECHNSTYTSVHTRCEITFLNCFTYTQLSQCLKKKCQRYIRAGECRLETSFVLEEKQCYRSCCGSESFDETVCNAYNSSQQSREEAATTGLTVILIVVALVLAGVVAVFVVRKLGCCEKRDPVILLRFNIKWRKDEYEDTKCDICHTYGPMMFTPCEHAFHVACFEESATSMVCPTCSQPILQRVKFFCFMCREKSFKAKLSKVSEIGEAMAEGRALHIDECPREIRQMRSGQALMKEEL